jgi:hypothetical protein
MSSSPVGVTIPQESAIAEAVPMDAAFRKSLREIFRFEFFEFMPAYP